MKCPECNAEIPDELIRAESARLGGRKSKRTVEQCPVHKQFLSRDGKCTTCEGRKKKKDEGAGW